MVNFQNNLKLVDGWLKRRNHTNEVIPTDGKGATIAVPVIH